MSDTPKKIYGTGMTNEMPNASDQSCLNRFLTEVDWDHDAMNKARIDWLQQFDDTKFHERDTGDQRRQV